MSSFLQKPDMEIQDNAYFILLMKDNVTKNTLLGGFSVKINNSKNYRMTQTNNSFCLVVPSGLTKELDFTKENTLKITSDYYHDCEITIKPDFTVEDKLGIYKLKKIGKTPFVRLKQYAPHKKGTLNLYDNDGAVVAKVETKDPLADNESVWISIQPSSEMSANEFKLIVKKFNTQVDEEDVISAVPAPPYPMDNLSVVETSPQYYQNVVNTIISMTKTPPGGMPVYTERNYEILHNKVDSDKIINEIKIIDSLYLHPLPTYPFPSDVQLLFGIINIKIDDNEAYRISVDELSYSTTATADGQFVFFIDDEMVKNTKILNSVTKKYEVTLRVEKLTFNKDKTVVTDFYKDAAKRIIDPDFEIYNFGAVGGTN